MSLLYPEFLWALLINIIPILIHLFNFQKYETIYFSDVSLFKNIEQKTKKRSQLKNLLILIFRILFISSIVLAFCFPYIPNLDKSTFNENAKIGIYLDNSFSMSRVNKNQSLLESAKDDLMKLVDNLPEKTEYIFTTNTTQKNKQFGIYKNELKNEIINTNLSPNVLSFADVLDIQKSQFKEEEYNAFYLTDFQQNIFDLDKINIDKNDRIQILNYTSTNSGNLSIDSVWFSESNRKINKTETLNVQVTNHSESNSEFQLKLNINQGEVLNQSYNEIKENEIKIIKFLFSINSKGYKAGTINLLSNINNAIKSDDEYYFSFSIKNDFKVVNLYDKNNLSNTYLKTLFNSVEKINHLDINLQNGYNDYDLNADLIILNQLSNINNQLLNHLFESDNKNLIIIPDLKSSYQYSNLFKILKIENQYIDSLSTELDIESFDLIFFNNIFFKTNDNIDLPYFSKHWNIKYDFNSQRLISYLNGDPFLLKIKKFNKNIYLFTSSLNKEISNLSQHALFVPIMLRIKEQSSNDMVSQNKFNELGWVAFSKSKDKMSDLIIKNDLKKPTFSFFPEVINSYQYGKVFLDNEISSTGHFYITSNDSVLHLFSVNSIYNESEMDFISKKEINTKINNLNLEESIKIWNLNENEYPKIVSNNYKNIEYWKYFILLGIIFLILEMIIIKKIA